MLSDEPESFACTAPGTSGKAGQLHRDFEPTCALLLLIGENGSAAAGDVLQYSG